MAGMQSRKSGQSAIELRRFHGYGMETSLSMIEENVPYANRVQLFPTEKIVFLDIRFGELFHRCTEEEWRSFRQSLADSGIGIKQHRGWWRFFSWLAI